MKRCLAVMVLVLIAGCGVEKPYGGKIAINNKGLNNGDHYVRVAEIDGCEYIIFEEGTNSQMMSHKGNCKFCKERR